MWGARAKDYHMTSLSICINISWNGPKKKKNMITASGWPWRLSE